MAIPINQLHFIKNTQRQIRKSKQLSLYAFLGIFLVLFGIIYYLTSINAFRLFFNTDYREGMVGQPRFLNPIYANENEIDRTITKLLFNSLVRYDYETQSFVGDIAERYEIEEDGKLYRFFIKDDLYFHDGVKLTIDDILFTYEVIQHDNYHGFWKDAFSSVTIEKVNDTELTMRLEAPLASFIEHNTIGIIPKHLFEDVNDALRPDHLFNVSPIGSGTYEYQRKDLFSEETSKIQSIYLTSTSDEAKIKNVRFTFFDTDDELITAYKMGEIDAFGSLNNNYKSELQNWTNYRLYTQTLTQRYYGLFFNLNKTSKIQDITVRQALSHALDKETLLKNLLPNETFTLVDGPIENSSWAYDPEIRKYEYDQEKAKELIAEIPQEELTLTLTYPETGNNQELAELIKKAWEEVGFTINLKGVALYNLRDQVIGPREFEIILLGQEVSHDPDRYAFWHSTQVDYPNLNISQYKDRFTDRSLETARTTTDEAKRIEQYKDFQRYIQNEIPVIMLYQPNYYYFVSHRFADKIEIKAMGIPEERFNSLLY